MSHPSAPSILWLRRDLRLSDHPALMAALEDGPVIPVFILDAATQNLGAAPRWRLGLSVVDLAQRLADLGSKLITRTGDPLEALRDIVAQTGAKSVHWSRLYDPVSIERDKVVKAGLTDDGVTVKSHAGHVLFEPWTVQTGTGGFYKVYTPFWKNVRNTSLAECHAPPLTVTAPENWPSSDVLDFGSDMQRGADIVQPYAVVGEVAAQNRLSDFLDERVRNYKADRDRPDIQGTSRLSENLWLGEISPRTVWHACMKVLNTTGGQGAETFLKEVVWRDFAWHLIYHTPHITSDSWRPEWKEFPWRGDNDDAERWRRGMTGEPIVDAGMRELYTTGYMHNRVRMIVACYLTKHLMTDWRVGQKWFEDTLIDHDPASNAMGWQWSAGSGPDATPYFRVFNPETQGEKFDPDGRYRKKWLANWQGETSDTAASFFQAIPKSWGMSVDDPYPERMIDLKAGRQRALDAYQDFKAG